jgi:oligopeptidase A
MENPLLDHSGLPRFATISPDHVEPALDRVLDDNLKAIDDLLSGGRSFSWESIVEPIEALEHRLGRTWAPVGHLNAVMNNAPLREAYNRCLPKLSRYSTEVGQNESLYRAYEAVASNGEIDDPARRAVVEHALRDFRLSGVALPQDEKARFKEIMEKLSSLQARFEENVLDSTNAWSRHFLKAHELEGLPEGVLDRAAETAASKGLKGWLFTLDFPTFYAIQTHAKNRDLRESVYRAWTTRASDTGPFAGQWDNTDVMVQILALRYEAAALLGFENYAQYSLATKMAGSVEQVLSFLDDLARKSRQAARRELAEVEALAGHPLEAWDIPFYSEKLRQSRFSISEEELRPYFPATKVLDGMFQTARRLFGIEIVPSATESPWHEDVGYYEVRDQEGPRGGFYVDLYARQHKRGGAWMDECIGRAKLDGIDDLPVALLICNFMPPSGKRPALLTHEEVVTLFHEFGHTLHHLLTKVPYPSVAGINGVAWDACELPSQFMENYAWSAEVLPTISGHFETGDPLPEEILQRLLDSRTFQAAMQMVRQVEFALFDFCIHSAPSAPSADDITATLASVRSRVAVVRYPDFNRFPHAFSHIFAGGYAAGYYSYKWAEVLSADAFSAFEEAGVFDHETGRRFLSTILEVGGSVPPEDAFASFRGRDPSPEPLLRQNGILDGNGAP